MAKNIFQSVSMPGIGSNVFDLSFDHKLSLDMGKLVPFYVQECIPGDRFNIQNEALLRFAPLIAPVMHKVKVYQHFFFVPNRLVWSNWEKFITNTKVGDTVPAHPVFNRSVAKGSVSDYFGLPITESSFDMNALPFAAYNKIYNEYYRDQNLTAPLQDTLVDGVQSGAGMTVVRNRAWNHDYFTSISSINFNIRKTT